MGHTVQLLNGNSIPSIGLGLYRSTQADEVTNAIRWAYEDGYRLFDTASYYGNEELVGDGLAALDADRESYFVTTKIWNDEQASGDIEGALDQSLKKLKLDYVDLYMIHWPVKAYYEKTWEEMLRLQEKGKIKNLGVCNCQEKQIAKLYQDTGLFPAVHQLECHPRYFDEATISYCQSHGIAVQAYCPLGRCKYIDDPVLIRIAEKHQKSASQVMLRWEMQKGILIIPKSVKKNRIHDNADLFDFSLDEADMADIQALNQMKRVIDLNPDALGL